ncbi:DNA polymerase/3'-5' exonuclease PolX [Zhaonella formicivorans]|uniref:DNA polymerase/3'-5' exonuclease PolX n=1 Tax=Zhaonella formicivorans TaxID=2528593 RepID=UPI0010EF6EA9|nr:DNA polymerase/3'-5' exonuclease PolX [Zhaonella formicivorans]
MTNLEIAWIFSEIADLLELKEESSFKVRAYRKAAKTIKHLSDDLGSLWKKGKLTELPGIGKNLSDKIAELLSTGQCAFHQRLKEEVPVTLRELLAIPGLGSKSVRLIHERLHVNNMEELEAAAKEKKIRTLPGMGSKTELNILRSIEMLKQNAQSEVPIGVALPLANLFLNDLKRLPEVTDGAICGSLRRGKELVKDIDLLIATRNPDLVRQTVLKHPQVKDIITSGNEKSAVLTWLGVKVEVRTVSPDQFWSALHHLTGSKEHHERLRQRARSLGLKVNEYGIFPEGSEVSLEIKGEEDIYRATGVPYIPPELREDSGEWEAALENDLPRLLELEDIKGDLHLHTSWSDGIHSIEEMADAARRKGYEYIAITDHSRSLGIANGLSIERLQEQHALIKQMNSQSADLKILTGVEADILQDGRLDYPDEILEQCDVVIASIHTGFRQEMEKLTLRAEAALKNPYVHILAHPTGRILGRRKPYDIDLDRLFQLAKAEGKALEINSSIDRLDLNAALARRAAYEFEIPIVINTDAHDVSRLEEMAYGVTTARRGWLTKEQVVNTKSKLELDKFLKRRRIE